MFNNIKTFFESDIFWGLLFSLISVLLTYLITSFKKYLKKRDKKDKQTQLYREISCLKNDLIIEMMKTKKDKKKIKQLQEQIDKKHKELNMLQD